MLIYIVFTTTTDWALVLFYMEQTSHPGRPTTFLRSCHTTQHRRKSNTGAQLCSAHLMGRAAGQACTAHPTTELGSTSHSTHPHSISFTDLMSSTSPYSDSAASVFLHFYCTQFFLLLFSQSFTCCIPQFTWFYTPPPTLYTHPQPALVGAWGGWGSRWQRTGVASPVFFFFFPPCAGKNYQNATPKPPSLKQLHWVQMQQPICLATECQQSWSQASHWGMQSHLVPNSKALRWDRTSGHPAAGLQAAGHICFHCWQKNIWHTNRNLL